jgi:hypothetical protein
VATIASLLVNLGMNVAGFQSGAKQGVASLASLSSAVTGLNQAMQLAQGGWGLLNGAFQKFHAVGESIRQIGEFSSMTGYSTERLVALQSAAKRFGVDAETMNTGLKKLVVNLGKAQEEGSPAADALRKLGLSAELLNKLGSDAAFNSVANAISRLPTPAEKAAAAVELFGKSGIELVNVLNLGKSGIDELQHKADELGTTFSKIDAERVTDAMRQLDGMTKEVSAAFREFAIIGGPTIQTIAGGFAQNLHDLRSGNLKKFARDVATGNLINFAEVQERQQRQREDEFYSKQGKPKPLLAEALESAADSAAKFKQSNTGSADLMKALDREQENRNRLFEVALSPMEQYLKKLDEIGQAYGKLKRANNLNQIDDITFNVEANKLRQAQARLTRDETKRQNEEQSQRLKSLKDNLETPGQKLRNSLADILAGQRSGQLSPQQAQLAALKAQKEFTEAQPADHLAIGTRPGALEKGSAAAFSASFGQTPLDKKTTKLIQLQQQANDISESIDKKLTPFNIGK